MNTYQFNEVQDKINQLARSAVQDAQLIMDMSYSGFEFTADICGDVTFEYTVLNGNCKVGCIFDNDYDNILAQDLLCGSGIATFKLSLQKGTHTIRIVKLSEYMFSGLCLDSFTIDGELLSPPKTPTLKFEFYGDSLTCGYGCLSPDRSTPADRALVENAYDTYCSLISREMNADISAACASGFGIILSCGGDRNDTIRAFYDKVSPKRNIDWDFKKYIPDVVFINLGTNDSEYCRNNKSFTLSYDELHDELLFLMNEIRKNAPKCKIVYVTGVSGDIKQLGQIDVEKVYENLEKEIPDSYYVSGMHTKQLGGDWHPNVEDHLDLAKRLMVELKKRIPEIFAK